MPTRWIGLLFIFLLVSCRPKFLEITNARSLENYLAVIEQSNAKVHQIKAQADIRGNGLLGHFFHERADIVAQAPHYFLWSLRSFFESPASIIASNGKFISVYDISNNAQPFHRIPLSENSVVELMDFPFQPKILLNLLLNKIDLRGAKNLKLLTNKNIWLVKADLDGDWHVHASFNEDERYFREIAFEQKKHKIKYRVRYGEMHREQGLSFPTSLMVVASMNGRSLKFNMRFEQLEINGFDISPDTFLLGP
ncbi:MAG: DUF4292 domain-containing protein [Myxococcales bacterium]|nr:DUF4292 domain-containing protein [Myxococcales bacterium]USN51607.1 MAG: DUF4292 domain-containing protein [Myxococcales bacterium]